MACLAYLILGELWYVIHCSVRLYLRVEVIDDGSETKEGNFQRSQEQLTDAAEIPCQSEQVYMEAVLQESPPSPQSTVCFAEGTLPAEANADPDTSLLEIASTGTVLHMAAFAPADTGLCLLLWQEELLGTGCKLLCVPAERQQTWPSLPHPAQELQFIIPSKISVAWHFALWNFVAWYDEADSLLLWIFT